MEFFFCERCGKRLTDKDIEEGRARHKQVKGVFCRDCSIGVMTVEFQAISPEMIEKFRIEQRENRYRTTTASAPSPRDTPQPTSGPEADALKSSPPKYLDATRSAARPELDVRVPVKMVRRSYSGRHHRASSNEEHFSPGRSVASQSNGNGKPLVLLGLAVIAGILGTLGYIFHGGGKSVKSEQRQASEQVRSKEVSSAVKNSDRESAGFVPSKQFIPIESKQESIATPILKSDEIFHAIELYPTDDTSFDIKISKDMASAWNIPELRLTSYPSSRAFLRFDLSSIDGQISSCKLYLHPTTETSRPVTLRIARNQTADWNEKEISLNNRPSIVDRTLEVTVQPGETVEIDLSGLVKRPFEQERAISIMLGLKSHGDVAVLVSREGETKKRPRLVIEFSKDESKTP